MQDVAGSDRPELLFVGNSDSLPLQHVPTDPIVADSARTLDAVGGEITADPAVGLVPGTAPAPVKRYRSPDGATSSSRLSKNGRQRSTYTTFRGRRPQYTTIGGAGGLAGT